MKVGGGGLDSLPPAFLPRNSEEFRHSDLLRIVLVMAMGPSGRICSGLRGIGEEWCVVWGGFSICQEACPLLLSKKRLL